MYTDLQDGAPEPPGSFTELHLALIRGSFQEKELTAAQQHMILQEMIALCKKREQRKNPSFLPKTGIEARRGLRHCLQHFLCHFIPTRLSGQEKRKFPFHKRAHPRRFPLHAACDVRQSEIRFADSRAGFPEEAAPAR